MSLFIDDCEKAQLPIESLLYQCFYQDSGGNIYLGVKQNAVDLTFQVGYAGGAALENASVTINGETQLTNALGITVFSIAPGTYAYTVTLANYTTINGNVTVTGDQTEIVRMFLVEVTNILASFTGTYTDAIQGGINYLIHGIHTLFTIPLANTIGAKFDTFYMLAAANNLDARVNWANLGNHTLTEVNAPTHTSFRGFQGDGINSYLNMNYNPNTQGINFTLNDAAFGYYSRTDIDTGLYDMGASDGTNIIRMRSDPSSGRMYINSAGPSLFTTVNSLGLFTGARHGAASTEVFRNNLSIDTDTDASSVIPSVDMFLLGYNNNGTPTLSTKQLAFAFNSSDIVLSEQSSFYTLIQTYMTLIGAQV